MDIIVTGINCFFQGPLMMHYRDYVIIKSDKWEPTKKLQAVKKKFKGPFLINMINSLIPYPTFFSSKKIMHDCVQNITCKVVCWIIAELAIYVMKNTQQELQD